MIATKTTETTTMGIMIKLLLFQIGLSGNQTQVARWLWRLSHSCNFSLITIWTANGIQQKYSRLCQKCSRMAFHL